jgi:O-methyltransferase involved in polyketide biosynthesis
MLWTLHNRASEARRPGGILRDPDAVRIYASIDYDFMRRFGKPDGSHALRSRLFDDALKPWLAAHPGGSVVELGAGLETQAFRCDDGRARWLCVDVPEAIDVRERFIVPDERWRHLRQSALDERWMDDVDDSRGLFITAQGLFMYFREADVQRLVCAIVERFPGAELMFDTIPRWFSDKTLKGFQKTKHYQAPPMPWGIDRSEIEPTLRRWSAQVERVTLVPYGYFRGLGGLVFPLFQRIPGLREVTPNIVRVRARGQSQGQGQS